MMHRAAQIEEELSNDKLWEEQEKAVSLMKEKSELIFYINGYNTLKQKQEDIAFMIDNPDFADDISQAVESLLEESKKYYIMCAFAQPCDSLDCFIQIQAGAGGTESEDWASMLLRMYIKFCEQEGYKVELIDQSAGEQPGLINSALLMITADKGLFPYGWLKYEHGIHRLVRISPFDSNQRRHTSFASVWISPKLNQTVDIEIKESDLEIRECRASGAGGQHVNKTNSAIQILHKPSGIVTQSQQERSQHQNREIAMQLLKSKLYLYEMEKLKAANKKHMMQKTDVSWGHQIRSYVLHPDKRIKDTRTGFEMFNTQKVLDGDIKPFILHAIEAEIASPGSVL